MTKSQDVIHHDVYYTNYELIVNTMATFIFLKLTGLNVGAVSLRNLNVP